MVRGSSGVSVVLAGKNQVSLSDRRLKEANFHIIQVKMLYLVVSAWWGIIMKAISSSPQSPLNCALWKQNVKEVTVSQF